MNRIFWTKKAVKQLRKLQSGDQVQIRDAVADLVLMPKVTNVKPLRNHAYGYRLRVGYYRILFDWHDSLHIVDIQEVKKRDERTY